jgi:hypothetical protein
MVTIPFHGKSRVAGTKLGWDYRIEGIGHVGPSDIAALLSRPIEAMRRWKRPSNFCSHHEMATIAARTM